MIKPTVVKSGTRFAVSYVLPNDRVEPGDIVQLIGRLEETNLSRAYVYDSENKWHFLLWDQLSPLKNSYQNPEPSLADIPQTKERAW